MSITIIKLKIAFKCTHYTKGYERTKIISTIKKNNKINHVENNNLPLQANYNGFFKGQEDNSTIIIHCKTSLISNVFSIHFNFFLNVLKFILNSFKLCFNRIKN
jgi:hypothetical protein